MANGSAGAPASRWVHGIHRHPGGLLMASVSDGLAGVRTDVHVASLNKWERGRLLRHHLGVKLDVRKYSSDRLYDMIVEHFELLAPNDPPSDPSNTSNEPNGNTSIPSSAGQGEPSGEPSGGGSGEPMIQGESSAPSVSATNVDPGNVEWATVPYVDERVQGVADNANAAIGALVDNVNAGFTDMVERMNYAVGSAAPRTVTIQLPNVDPVTITGSHHMLPTATGRVAAGMNVMLVGPAGTGKSWLAHDIARALGVPCREISVTIQTQDWRINGANTATTFIRGVARECYEHGGLLLIDEFDNGSPNFLAGLNLLLSSGTYTFADGVTVERHPQFYVVATANTIGEGGTAQYNARNKVDGATMDRFVLMFIDMDPSIEDNMVAKYLEDATQRADLLKFGRTVRKNITENNLRVLFTPRGMERMAICLALGESMDTIIRDCVTRGCSDDIAEKILEDTGYSV